MILPWYRLETNSEIVFVLYAVLNQTYNKKEGKHTRVLTVLRRYTMSEIVGHRYIESQPGILGGEPIIVGTRTPVRAIVEMWRMGYAPEEIPTSLPHLTLAQVFDALSYYSDHQDKINAYIESNRIPDELIDPLVRDIDGSQEDTKVTIDIPQDILDSARMSVLEIKRELAVHLYAQRRLSVGKARELAEMSLWQFRHLLAARQVPVQYDVTDLEKEVATLKKMGRL